MLVLAWKQSRIKATKLHPCKNDDGQSCRLQLYSLVPTTGSTCTTNSGAPSAHGGHASHLPLQKDKRTPIKQLPRASPVPAGHLHYPYRFSTSSGRLVALQQRQRLLHPTISSRCYSIALGTELWKKALPPINAPQCFAYLRIS